MEKKNYKVTVNDLYIELKKLVENGYGEKQVKVSVNFNDCNHLQNLRAISDDCRSWILLMGYD